MKLNVKRDRQININTNPNWLTLLGVILVLLKVTEYTVVAIWPWWKVLLPFYIGLLFFFGILLGGAAFFGLLYCGCNIADWCIRKYYKIKRNLKK